MVRLLKAVPHSSKRPRLWELVRVVCAAIGSWLLQPTVLSVQPKRMQGLPRASAQPRPRAAGRCASSEQQQGRG